MRPMFILTILALCVALSSSTVVLTKTIAISAATATALTAVKAGALAVGGGFLLGAAKASAVRGRRRGRRETHGNVDAVELFLRASNQDEEDCVKKVVCLANTKPIQELDVRTTKEKVALSQRVKIKLALTYTHT